MRDEIRYPNDGLGLYTVHVIDDYYIFVVELHNVVMLQTYFR